MSKRKPFNDCKGYVASRHNLVNDGWAVIYKASEADLDQSGGPWVCICEEHHTLCNFTSLEKARAHLPYVDWCEECMKEGDYGLWAQDQDHAGGARRVATGLGVHNRDTPDVPVQH